MPNKPKRLSPETVDRVLALAETQSPNQIARQLGVSRQGVRNVIERAGLPVKAAARKSRAGEHSPPAGGDDAKRRKCLGPCGGMFWSLHKGNRLCKACAGRAEGLRYSMG